MRAVVEWRGAGMWPHYKALLRDRALDGQVKGRGRCDYGVGHFVLAHEHRDGTGAGSEKAEWP